MLEVQTNLVQGLIITGVHNATYFADGYHIGDSNWVIRCTNKSGN